MFLINGLKAQLIQYNRNQSNSIYDDQDQQTVSIKVCPYDISDGVRFGLYTVPEAKGYFQVKRTVDVKEGDQIIFDNKTYTILNVQDNWLYNRVENKILAVK